jgi:hypothetical protein
MSWSKNRKFTIALGVMVVVAGAIVVPTFLYFYEAPTCFDGIKNGNEQDIDCGGSCERLCQSAFEAPNVAWTRFEQITSGLYNVATYIVNKNPAGEAVDVPYRVTLYDSKGILIIEQNGKVTLPPHRNTLAYQGTIDTGKRVPVRALFEFTKNPDWYKKSDPLASISIADKNYSEDEAGSSLMVTLGNNSVLPLSNITVYVILYDIDSNVLGFSKTLVDEIPAKGTTIAPFTWPVNRHGSVISIEVLPVSE